jgi:hypothetical protein
MRSLTHAFGGSACKPLQTPSAEGRRVPSPKALGRPVPRSREGAREARSFTASTATNAGGAFVRVSGGARALVLSERPAEAEALVASLTGAGFEVALRDRTGVPADLGTLAGFDLVVLSDLGARALNVVIEE